MPIKVRRAVHSAVVRDTNTRSIWAANHSLHLKGLILCFALLLAGCGNPKTTTNPPPPPPPPPNLPMTGSWVGTMGFTTITGNLTLALSQDGSNHLTGAATSTPPLCSFNSQVTGTYFSDGQFQVVSKDGIETFTGSISADKKSLSGTVQIGNGGGCGPRFGSFNLGKQ